MLRRLHPPPGADDPGVDPAVAHAVASRPAPEGRPWLALNMIVSLDGATAVAGRSGGLGGPADRAVFSALRAVSDVILVGAGTLRTEDYGPPRTPPARRAERVARGQGEYPRLAVVSASVDLDPQRPVFADAPEPPLLYTVADAPPDRVAAMGAVCEVVVVGAGRVDPRAVLADLDGRGVRTVLAEGGPKLNGDLVAAGLVDELDLTVAPLLVGGDSDRVAVGPEVAPRGMALAHLWEADGFLFARYTRAVEGGG